MSMADNDEILVSLVAQMRISGVSTGPIAIRLHYTRTDPYAVWLTYPTKDQCFARDLLFAALAGVPSGDGHVHIRCDDDNAYIELARKYGIEVIQMSRKDAEVFATATLEHVPSGDESRYLDLDETLAQIITSTGLS